jgi:hypothetical protein
MRKSDLIYREVYFVKKYFKNKIYEVPFGVFRWRHSGIPDWDFDIATTVDR